MQPSPDHRDHIASPTTDGEAAHGDEPIAGELPRGFRAAPSLDASAIRKLPLSEQVAMVVRQALSQSDERGLSSEAAKSLVAPVKDALSSNLFDHVLSNIQFSTAQASERVEALEALCSVFARCGRIPPNATIGLDHHGEPVTLGDRLSHALPAASRIVTSADELLRLLRIPVPETSEWRDAKDLAIARTIYEGSYGKGFLYLRPDGRILSALSAELSAPTGEASRGSALADALRSVNPSSSFERTVADLAEGLANVARESRERYEVAIAVSDRLGEPLRTIAETAAYLRSRPEEYRQREPLGNVDAAVLSKAASTLAEIAVEHELSTGKASLEEAFVAKRFDSFAELLRYADPNRVAGFRNGAMHWRDQQAVAIRLFDWIGSMPDDALDELRPSSKDFARLLEVPTLFPRGQLHEPPSGPHIYPVIEKFARIAFERASTIEDWVEIARFEPQHAAEFEGQKRALVLEHLPKLFGMADRPAEIVAALQAAGERQFERPIEMLSSIPANARLGEILPILLESLRSGDPRFAPAVRELCRNLLDTYASNLAANEPGYSKTELKALTRAYRSTTAIGRLVNMLWPF